VENCNESHDDADGFTIHGELTVASLLAMLAEDASMVVTRPGSWEGSSMARVQMSHGGDM
jgi:hypothetical protein